jgi:hypothetical protein
MKLDVASNDSALMRFLILLASARMGLFLLFLLQHGKAISAHTASGAMEYIWDEGTISQACFFFALLQLYIHIPI